MVNLRVVNWRCIESLEFELAKLNVFIGPNSTGKSSLAYSIYFASKSKTYDPQYLMTQLYGHDFNMVARLVENEPQFPISIRIADSEFSVRPEPLLKLPKLPGKDEEQKIEEKEVKEESEGDRSFEITRLSKSPWVDEYLLPSRRVDYVHIMAFLPKITRELRAKPEGEAVTRMFGSWIGGVFELIRALPILPPFGIFASDYTKALTGFQPAPLGGKLREAGSYIIDISPLFSLIEHTFIDPYTELQLPTELAPDGLVDSSIFDGITQKIPANSLVVIEEPEIYKNPLRLMEFTEHIVERVLDRKLTLITTTHSDIPLTTMAKLVSQETLEAEDVKIYYFKRDPWTKISEIKLYEDGTLERLPDAEELITRLF